MKSRFDGISPEDRAELMERYRVYRGRYYGAKGAPRLSDQDRKHLAGLMDHIRTEYSDRIPRVALSRCPICGEILRRAFDPYGLDGFWWHAVSPIRFCEPPCCRHFAVMIGALNLHGRAPMEASEAVEPGPEAPFAIPRLLELDGMIAVLNSLRMPTGDTAYPIAYFAEKAIPSAALHQPWPKRSYQVVDEDGNPAGWSVKVDAWDFELDPWIERGRLLWIEPGDEGLRLRGKDAGPCPYRNLPGDRQPQRIQKGRRVLLLAPTGGEAQPFE